MTKDNFLFSIIGILLGFIIGFMFATSAIQRTAPPRASSPAVTSMPPDAELPPDHPPVSANAAADQSAPSQETLAALQKAKSEPKNFDAQMDAARRLYEQRQYDQAATLFESANKLQPDNYDAITALGNTYFDAGRYDLAEKWYTNALAKKPDDINVRTDLGLTYFFRKPPDIDRAIKEFRASLQRDPTHEQTLINLIIVLSEKGDTKEAQATLAQFEKAYPNNVALPKLRSRVEAIAGTEASQNKP